MQEKREYLRGEASGERRIYNITEETKMSLKESIKDIQLTLENGTNRKIRLIAEGHLDLSRKLDEALKVENEKEMLLIRVNSFENDIRKLKAKIEAIA